MKKFQNQGVSESEEMGMLKLEPSRMFKLNIQFFASSEEDDNDDDEDDKEDDHDKKDDEKTNKDGSKDNDPEKGGTGKTFTQEQVKKMMTREKKQGRSALIKELGFSSEKEMQEMMKGFKAFRDSQKTDEEKAAEAQKENEAKIREAEERANQAEAKIQAIKLGAKPECVDDIVSLALTKVDDDNDFKTVIGELKTKYASMFNDGKEDDKGKKGNKGTGSTLRTGGGSKGGSGEESLGARLAGRRTANKAKKSLWK